MKKLSAGFCAALSLWMIVSPVQAEEKPAVIRLAFTSAGASGKGENGSVLLAAYRQGILEQEFKADGIRVEWSLMAGGPATTEMLSQNRVDFAAQANMGAISGRAAGLRHKVLLALNRFGSSYIVVRADSPARTLDDLKGKRLGTIRGVAGDLSLRRILESEGLGEKDFEIVNLKGNAATVQAALAAGEIDGHFMSQPFDLEAQGRVKIVYRSRRNLDISGLGVFLVTEEFEREFPSLVQRVVNVLVRTAAWTAEEKNRAAVFQLWAESDSERAAIEKKWEGLSLKEGLSPLLDDYIMADLRRCVRDSQRFGFSARAANLAGWVEPKYLQAAVADAHLERHWPRFDAGGKIVVETAR